MWLVQAFRGGKQDRFFALLGRQAQNLTRAADALAAYSAGRHETDADAAMQAARDSAICFDEVIAALEDTFVTPVDRQDIYNMSVILEDAADYFAGAATELRLFDVTPSADMCDIIAELQTAAGAAREAVMKLEQEPTGAIASGREAMRREGIIEDKYRRVLAALFNRDDFHAILREREIYRHLSNSADRIDDVGRLAIKCAVKMS